MRSFFQLIKFILKTKRLLIIGLTTLILDAEIFLATLRRVDNPLLLKSASSERWIPGMHNVNF